MTQVATIDAPVAGVAGPGGTVWLAERAGVVRVFDGQTLGEPVLDISAETTVDGERGLLGLAFDNTFEHFYISYTDLDGTSIIDEIAVVDGAIQLDTRRTVLIQTQPFSNHNGGDIAFGPDGMLYIAFGDGGGSGDPLDAGQDLSTFLGKILRIDPTGDDPYAIPPDNPFVGDPAVPDEIWAYGLRNPWRFSFDAVTGELWIADVGQNLREEINRAPAGVGGQNYGWARMEGTLPFSGDEPADHVPPVFEYVNDGARCSVTGGYVYRGNAIPALQGAYLFSDYCESDIRALDIQDGEVLGETNLISVPAPGTVSFVEGPDRELYVLALGVFGGGTVSRIDSTGPPPTPTPTPPPASPTPTAGPPAEQCTVSITRDQWDNGFVATYTVTNTGPAWSGWTLTFTVADGVTHEHGWNGDFTQNGAQVTVTDEAWNGSVATGESVMPGHQASHTGTVTTTDFAVNGEACAVL